MSWKNPRPSCHAPSDPEHTKSSTWLYTTRRPCWAWSWHQLRRELPSTGIMINQMCYRNSCVREKSKKQTWISGMIDPMDGHSTSTEILVKFCRNHGVFMPLFVACGGVVFTSMQNSESCKNHGMFTPIFVTFGGVVWTSGLHWIDLLSRMFSDARSPIPHGPSIRTSPCQIRGNEMSSCLILHRMASSSARMPQWKKFGVE